jgi:hypothetical protein
MPAKADFDSGNKMPRLFPALILLGEKKKGDIHNKIL